MGQGWGRGEVGTGWDIVKLGGADKSENPQKESLFKSVAACSEGMG